MTEINRITPATYFEDADEHTLAWQVANHEVLPLLLELDEKHRRVGGAKHPVSAGVFGLIALLARQEGVDESVLHSLVREVYEAG